tara:strand:- start:12783 stop:13118 length:336 start_codon:yes stop_codon:yes gene_type:complete
MGKLDLHKKVYNKEEYKKIIDTSFKEFGVKSIQEQIEDLPTVEDFFKMYNELFYEIPEKGEEGSHEFLIKSSSEYINFDENNELIEALQAEIGELREELLEAQKQIFNIEN